MPKSILIQPIQNSPLPSETLDEIDQHRGEFYQFLASLFFKPPTQTQLDFLASLNITDDSLFGTALKKISDQARLVSAPLVKQEFDALFTGLTRGEVMPYGSYYLTGFLYEKPVADIRTDMAKLGLKRAETCQEPEDHFAVLCAIMAHLVSASLDQQKIFFEAHIQPWVNQFLDDLETAPSAQFYKNIAELTKIFIVLEIKSFDLVTA
ncbi:TorD/DmsD family molecular chaperone [Entomobacter blattae]|uniref:Chaperone protein TorD n=1 Tax=Entomobacter blattae TaxID=2762277 RepID=A0A7H1NT23_9PROT|nr:molecular chaperone TorD family protein [Entomobacter blattae]QNT78933.1 Chaperone protein TorD [Entomobacter blattae]